MKPRHKHPGECLPVDGSVSCLFHSQACRSSAVFFGYFFHLGMAGVFWAVRLVSEPGLKQTSNFGHSSLI